jgi:hypothetical protein
LNALSLLKRERCRNPVCHPLYLKNDQDTHDESIGFVPNYGSRNGMGRNILGY